jgi:glyoxylase-like metal-dependent hydrolase (beta-lactamase superfamily II)
MERILPSLHASAPQSLSFAPEFEIRAFLLRRDDGNFLIYSTETLPGEEEAIAELGGVKRHYLAHSHEASFGCDRAAEAFDAPLVCHEKEQPEVSENCAVDETFKERHRPDEDFEVIPIPGHTPGATAYLWKNGEHRCLFVGDSLYLRDDGSWGGGLIESSDRDAYFRSLEGLREVEFDVLVPWATKKGMPLFDRVDPSDARRRIDAILERVRAGEHE